MSRQKTDLRPSVSKMTIKSPLPNIQSPKEKFRESLKLSEITSLAKRNASCDKTDQLIKEIEKWRQKFSISQKSLEESRADIKFKDDTIAALEQKIRSLNAEHKKNLQAAKLKFGNHNECNSEIEKLKEKLSSKEKQIEDLRKEVEKLRDDFEEKLNAALKLKQQQLEECQKKFKEEREEFQKQLETQISLLKQLHKEQMNAKDEKLNILKKQVADALTGSSIERQQQIEELLKELKRVSEEADAVKTALRHVKSKGDCQKCAMYQKKCHEMQEQLKIQDSALSDLIRVGSKMERQISQQDELVALWTKVKKENEKSSR